MRPQADELPYVTRLKNWDHDDLAEVAEHVASLTEHKGWQAVVRLLEESHSDMWTRMLAGHGGSTGRVLDQAEYARILAFLAGLNEFQAAQRAFAIADERRRENDRRAAAE